MTDSAPNFYAVLIALIQMVGTAFAVYLAYRQTRKGQDPKLDRIETATNGALDTEKKKVEALEAENARLRGES